VLKNECPLINRKTSEIAIDLINLIHTIDRTDATKLYETIGRCILDNKAFIHARRVDPV